MHHELLNNELMFLGRFCIKDNSLPIYSGVWTVVFLSVSQKLVVPLVTSYQSGTILFLM